MNASSIAIVPPPEIEVVDVMPGPPGGMIAEAYARTLLGRTSDLEDIVVGEDWSEDEDEVLGQVLGFDGGGPGWNDEGAQAPEDVLGDDEEWIYETGDIVGRRPRRRRRRKKRSKARMLTPGVQRPGERRQFLPLGEVLFINAGATTLSPPTTNCQRPFRGTRLIIARANSAAAAALLGVTLSDFRIGNDPQPAVAGETPIEAFQAQAFDLAVDLNSSQPGIVYRLTFTISAAPAVTETVRVTSALFGKSLV